MMERILYAAQVKGGGFYAEKLYKTAGYGCDPREGYFPDPSGFS